MKIEFNIRKRYVFVILAAVLLIGIVIAYGGNQPTVMGHNSGEINVDASVTGTAQSLNSLLSWVYTQIGLLDGRIGVVENEITTLYAGVNCPLGMFEVGASPGIKGSYCISSQPLGTSNWAQAVQQCVGSGNYLCNTAELVGACVQVGYTPSTQFGWGTAHWAADLESSSNAIVVGAGSCSTLNSATITNTIYQHRCCKNLIGNGF